MIRSKRRCWLFWGLFAVLMLMPTLSHAQSIRITRATYRVIRPNVWRYTIQGTVNGVGNNYTVNLKIYDRFGVVISTSSVTYTNGQGTWSRTWTGVGGGRWVRATLVDLPGIKDEADLEGDFVATKEMPTLSEWGAAILLLLLVTTAAWTLRRKRLSTTT